MFLWYTTDKATYEQEGRLPFEFVVKMWFARDVTCPAFPDQLFNPLLAAAYQDNRFQLRISGAEFTVSMTCKHPGREHSTAQMHVRYFAASHWTELTLNTYEDLTVKKKKTTTKT